jgi:hypothetical protein
MGEDDLFIGGRFVAGLLNDNVELRIYESEALKYFPNCPICGSGKIQVRIVMGGKDILSSQNCDSRSHLYFGFWDLKWAKLELEIDDGGGKDLQKNKLKLKLG